MTREHLALGLNLFDQLDRLKAMIAAAQEEDGLSADEQVGIVKMINAAIDRTQSRIDDL